MSQIYILIDPRDDLIRYVGGTAHTARVRFKKHLTAKASTNCGAWIRELKALGLKPLMRVIETIDGPWRARERFWIANYRNAYGADLLNDHPGGNGGVPGWHHTEEAKRKIGARSKGRQWSAARRERLKQRIFSPESRDRIAAAHRGKRHTPETIEKMRKTRIGRKHSAAALEKLRNRKQSAETRAKISAARKGIALSADHRQKISDAIRQRGPRPIETRNKISATLRAIHAREAGSVLVS